MYLFCTLPIAVLFAKIHKFCFLERTSQKPLILRGARQVGNTTAVEMFSKKFDQYIYLNLEKMEERVLFEKQYPFSDLLMAIFVYARKETIQRRNRLHLSA
jgi:hypothetical protein